MDTPDQVVTLVLGFFFMITFVVIMVTWLVQIAICFLLYRANEALPGQFRRFDSWQAFLLLIPLFDLFWNFMIYPRLSHGYRAHLETPANGDPGDCGAGLGLWYSIARVAWFVPCLQIVAIPTAFVLLVMYLVRLNDLRGRVLVESMT